MSDPDAVLPQADSSRMSSLADEGHVPSLTHISHLSSPALLVEVDSEHNTPVTGVLSDTTFQRPQPRPHQTLGDDNIEFFIGSEPSSDESDDEEELSVPFLPRSISSLLDTPVDEYITAEPTQLTEAEVTDTELPRRFFDFDWETFPSAPISPESSRESFSRINVGPVTPCVDPYDIFVAIWDRQIMEKFASETNKYAQQVAAQLLQNSNLRPNSRINRWRDTSVDELYVYFGVVLAMGIVVKSRLEEYWNTDADIFYTPGFSANMSFNRFTLLTKFLHFNDNNDMLPLELDASEAKLFKIMPIITHLNRKFQAMYNLSQNISLDESLLMWKGWLDVNQLIPNRAAKIGIKSYEICESRTGYLWRFEIHAHKIFSLQELENPLNAFTSDLVLRLLRGLEYLGHTVWMGNYYNSPAMARCLKSLGFDCVGTLRTNRNFVPQALHSLSKDKMRQDQLSALTSGDVDVMVWKDSNRVAMISTYHGNGISRNEGSTKPVLILDYNIMMGGLDKKDQMLAMYPVERKRMRVWYKKLFRRLLSVSVLNSYIIHKQSVSSSALSHRSFRISLVKTLLAKHAINFPRPSVTATQNTVHVDIAHRISEYPLERSQHQRMRRMCSVCKKKRVHTFCVGCEKAVCIEPCFFNLH